ncbi:MAG: GYF domain-containing protein [Lacipirellulaceae bacterium]
MGIRFACPNGHKLNVKAELAGKRAICPKCKTKLLIPTLEEANENSAEQKAPAEQPASTSEQPAAKQSAPQQAEPTQPEAPTSAAPETGPTDLDQSIYIPTNDAKPEATETTPQEPSPAEPSPPEPPAPPALVEEPQPEEPATETVWYVRSATGEQFGPAGSEAMREWIEQGRVAADSWTWRTGWEDWKPGTEAIAEVNASNPIAPPVEPAAAMGAAAATLSEPSVSVASQNPFKQEKSPTTGAAEARRLAREKKKKRNQIITIVLAVLTLALGGVLAYVLWPKSLETPKPPTNSTERVAPVAEPEEEIAEEEPIEEADDEELEDLEEDLEERSGGTF